MLTQMPTSSTFQVMNEQYELLKLEAEIFKLSLEVNNMLVETFQIESNKSNLAFTPTNVPTNSCSLNRYQRFKI